VRACGGGVEAACGPETFFAGRARRPSLAAALEGSRVVFQVGRDDPPLDLGCAFDDLEELARGELVGERTFGLASEQKLITLDDGSALILTVANYYNGSGKSILDEGVVPTEIVRAAFVDGGDGSDDDDSTTNTGAATPQTPPSIKPLSPDDPVLKKALELFKTPAKKAA